MPDKAQKSLVTGDEILCAAVSGCGQDVVVLWVASDHVRGQRINHTRLGSKKEHNGLHVRKSYVESAADPGIKELLGNFADDAVGGQSIDLAGLPGR